MTEIDLWGSHIMSGTEESLSVSCAHNGQLG
jgi:hypothetical protein